MSRPANPEARKGQRSALEGHGSEPAAKSKEPSRGGEDAGEREETQGERWLANLRTIGGAVLLAFFIRIALLEAFEIEGPSMEPTLLNGDRVVVAKFLYGLFLPFTEEAVLTWGQPNAGDVVIVKSPADRVDIVKRVIGIAGDTIEIRDDAVFRNGEPIPRERLPSCGPFEKEFTPDLAPRECFQEILGEHVYETSRSRIDIAPRANELPLKVPEGHVYVLGDHRDRSNDSRNRQIGAFPVARVKGRALFTYWSNGGPTFSDARFDRLFSSVR